MRTLLLALAVLVSACVVESVQGPGVRPAKLVPEPPKCQNARPTGSNIARTECQPELSPAEEMAATAWRNRFPFNPTVGADHTDTPGVKVYR